MPAGMRNHPPPKDFPSWKRLVEQLQIGNEPLTSFVTGGKFSGSCMPFNSFLQLRAIWLESRGYGDAFAMLRGTGIMTEADWQLAGKIVKSNSNGIAQAHNFFEKLACQPKTPSSEYSASIYGAFAVPLLLYRALTWYAKKGAARHTPNWNKNNSDGGDSNDAWTPKILHCPPEYDMEGVRQMLDYNPPDPERAKDNENEDSLENLDYLNDLSLSSPEELSPDSPSAQRLRQKQERLQNPSTNAEPSAGDSHNDESTTQDHGIGPTMSIPALPAVSFQATYSFCASANTIERPHPSRRALRTTYETQTSSFFFGFLSALLVHVLPHSDTPCIMAMPEERPYHFGKPSVPGDKKQKNCLYIAVPDGAFISQKNWNTSRFAHFELKPFQRQEGASRSSIVREETAEIAAILYESCRNDK